MPVSPIGTTEYNGPYFGAFYVQGQYIYVYKCIIVLFGANTCELATFEPQLLKFMDKY